MSVSAQLQNFQQAAEQSVVQVGLEGLKAQFVGHHGLPARLKLLPIAVQRLYQRFRLLNQGVEGVGKLDQVPMVQSGAVCQRR